MHAKKWCKGLAFLALFGFATALQAGVVLQDDFEDGTLDPAKWTVVAGGGATVVEADGAVTLTISNLDRPYLASVGEWNPAEGTVTVTGRVTFPAGNASIEVWTRASDRYDSGALPNGTGVLSDGIYVASGVSGYDGMVALAKKDTEWPWEGFGEVTVPVGASEDRVWDFEVVDDGTNFNATFTSLDHPELPRTLVAAHPLDQGVYHVTIGGTLLSLEEITISVEDGAGLAGDLNSDGFVGGDDLDIVRSFWGQNVTAGELLQGDPSGDGFVGGDDLDIVRGNWGQGTPPAPSAVPEPSTLVFLLAGLAMWLGHRREV